MENENITNPQDASFALCNALTFIGAFIGFSGIVTALWYISSFGYQKGAYDWQPQTINPLVIEQGVTLIITSLVCALLLIAVGAMLRQLIRIRVNSEKN